MGSETVELNGRKKLNYNSTYRSDWKIVISWDNLFSLIGPYLFSPIHISAFEKTLTKICKTYLSDISHDFNISNFEYQKVKMQFYGLKLINVYSAQSVNNGGMNEYVNLTSKGKEYLTYISTIKKSEIEIATDIE
jgi:hypothetical protein